MLTHPVNQTPLNMPRPHRSSHAWLTLLLAAACLAFPAMAQEKSGAPVVTTTVQEQEVFRVLQLTGTVTSARSSRLSAATSGLVAELLVDAGSRVEQGQLLLQMDEELAQLQARGATAAVEQANIAVQDARRRLEEARSLAPQQSIAESVVKDIAAEVSQDEAALHQAEAEAGYRRGILARHKVKAPFSGVISAKLTELGEWVNPGQPVLELVSLDDVRLDFPVAEDFAADITVGAPMRFGITADPDKRHDAVVATVVPVTDPGARTFLLRVEPSDTSQRLIPGTSVQGSLKLATGRRAVVVPRDGIVRSPGGRIVVWTVEEGEDGAVVRENVVSTGLSFDALVEVTTGLQAGARIVIRGNEALQNGQSVVIRSAGDA